MEFTFSIRTALRESWELFKGHWKFFVGISLVTVLLNIVGNWADDSFFPTLIITVAAFIWGVIMLRISLSATSGSTDALSFEKIKEHVPHWKQFFGIIGVGIMSALIILGGFILLIIPGIYFAFRLSVSNLSYLDRKEGVMKALRYSWDSTKGGKIWTVILVAIVSVILYIVGLILFGVGILVTYPLALLLMAKLYRALSAHHSGHMAVAPQPVEIPAHTEPTPEPHHESDTPAQ